MATRRELLKLSGLTLATAALGQPLLPADYSLDIAPYTLEAGPRRNIRTIAYNGQVPGPLLRFQEGRPVTIDVTNHTGDSDVVHWHGLFLPPEIDGAMEEGTPPIRLAATPATLLPRIPPAFAGITPTYLPAKICIAANTPASMDFS